MNILFLTNELNYTDGVSAHLYYLIKNLLKHADLNLHLICGGGDALEKFRDLKIEIISERIFNHKYRSTGNFIGAFNFTRKFVRSNNIELVHSHNHYAANIANYVSKFSDIITFQTNHGIIPDKGRLKHFSADKYIVVNNYISDYLTENNTALPENIFMIFSGVDFENGKYDKNFNPAKVISASRLEKGKGLDTIIKAVSLLSPDVKKKAEFIIAGEGSMKNELEKLNAEMNTGIIFPGNLKNIRDVFKKSEIFISASQSEGLPISMLEAAAERNLIISSDFRGVESIIENNKDGLIFGINNASELASKITFALNNKDHVYEMTENLFLKARIKFNSDIMADKHYSIYRKVIAK
jgi:glycosyltransferase involved in cell wall biosynthesis